MSKPYVILYEGGCVRIEGMKVKRGIYDGGNVPGDMQAASGRQPARYGVLCATNGSGYVVVDGSTGEEMYGPAERETAEAVRRALDGTAGGVGEESAG